MTIKVGERVPPAVFPHVPYTPELDDLSACGTVVPYNIDQEWAGKKVVVVSVPGAFTPTCHVNHIPSYIHRHEEFKAKGVDIVAVIAANDPFVLSGWARVENFKHKLVALTDTNAQWSESIGLSIDLSAKGLGVRTTRYALILDDLVVKRVEVESDPGAVSVSGAEYLLKVL